MDVIYTLIDWIQKAKYEDMPPDMVETAKKLIIDTLGVTIAGSSAAGCKTLADLVLKWRGEEEASVLVFGGKVPAPNAGLVNCMMARAWDFGDMHDPGGGHIAETIVPATFIMSEYCQREVSGREFLLSMVLGAEINCRLRYALTSYLGWLADTLAPFGVVATSAKLLDFSKEQLINGMGIAYSHCSCNLQANIDSALTIRLQQGIGAKAGILSAILAERGITGARDCLQGKYGFYPLYARNEYDPNRITDDLGKRFEWSRTSLKPYPCCKFTHIPIDASLQLISEHTIKPEEIDSILVMTNSRAYAIAGAGESKYNVRSIIDAQFSIQYAVAAAILKGKGLFIDDFTEASIRKPEVLDLCRKVQVVVDNDLDKSSLQVAPCIIKIRIMGGNEYSTRMDFVKGSPEAPMTWVECEDKFRKCARWSAAPLSEENINRVIESVNNFEHLNNVNEIIQLLT